MDNKSKITIKYNWQVTKQKRVSIVNSTYRQALSYINYLRLYNVKDILIKPILDI